MAQLAEPWYQPRFGCPGENLRGWPLWNFIRVSLGLTTWELVVHQTFRNAAMQPAKHNLSDIFVAGLSDS